MVSVATDIVLLNLPRGGGLRVSGTDVVVARWVPLPEIENGSYEGSRSPLAVAFRRHALLPLDDCQISGDKPQSQRFKR